MTTQQREPLQGLPLFFENRKNGSRALILLVQALVLCYNIVQIVALTAGLSLTEPAMTKKIKRCYV